MNADLRAELERHQVMPPDSGDADRCDECALVWPCDAARALEALDAMEDGSAYQLAIEQVRYEEERRHAAEAQVAALLQDKAAAHARAEEREAELDLAIAHDRQLYPTAAAYEAVCVARDKHAARADAAEAQVIEAVEAVFTAEKSKHEAQAAALASAERERQVVAQMAVLVEALERMLRHIESPLDPNCHCLAMGRDVLSDLSAAAAEHDARIAREALAAERERLRNTVLQRDHDLALNDQRVSRMDDWAESEFDAYESGVAGFLALLSEEAER